MKNCKAKKYRKNKKLEIDNKFGTITIAKVAIFELLFKICLKP